MKKFFIAGEPPTVTQQEHRIGKRKDGSVYVYENQNLKQAREELRAKLWKRRPEQPMLGPLRLIVKWIFKSGTKHPSKSWKVSKPDTDNMNKMLKDVMTDCEFWDDDAQVTSEIIEKFYDDIPGIYVQIDEL